MEPNTTDPDGPDEMSRMTKSVKQRQTAGEQRSNSMMLSGSEDRPAGNRTHPLQI